MHKSDITLKTGVPSTIQRVAIFLIAYNEAATIAGVLRDIDPSFDVYVVDDGSTDDTAEISRRMHARVIRHPINIGQGGAILTAFKLAVTLPYEAIVLIDADGQHDPRQIPRFIERLCNGTSDIVQGSRILGSDYQGAPIMRKLFLQPLTMVINILSGYQLSDAMCGFRAYRMRSLRSVSYFFDRILESQYMAPELWIRFAHAGLTVEDLPIPLKKREYGSSYKGLFRYAWGVFVALVRAKLDIYRDDNTCRKEKL